MSEPQDFSRPSPSSDPAESPSERVDTSPSPPQSVPQIPEPAPAELADIPADRRLELLELQRQRLDAERDRQRQSRHQWFNSVGIMIGVLAAVAGLVTTAVSWRMGLDELRTTKEGQVTDRYAKAVEQLGSDKREVRTAAVYALERIARDSGRDRPTIINVLAAYTREHDPAATIKDAALPPEPEIDVAAALAVLGRLPRPPRTPTDPVVLDLHNVRVPGGRFVHADLTDANLTGANLRDADLIEADLTDADLRGANLDGANLRDAHVPSGNLRAASLTAANLYAANLDSADLRGANLNSADLRDANLDSADLRNADLAGANLKAANLQNIKGKSADEVRRVAVTNSATRF